eukprot:6179386-Pleurochrysis_carterae.AAC.3
MTARFALGTQILSSPGERTLRRPRLMPSHARATLCMGFRISNPGFTTNARQPKGSMLIMRGLTPVRSS